MKQHLDGHFARAHEETKPTKECNICAAKFHTNQSLDIHVAAVHEGKKPFQCPICDSAFAHKSSLVKHIDGIHERKKAYHCSICKANFSQQSNLNTHIRGVHEKKRPKNQLSSKTKLSKNINIKENDSNQKDLNAEIHNGKEEIFCSKCKINFTKKFDFTVHNAVVHSLIVVLEDIMSIR